MSKTPDPFVKRRLIVILSIFLAGIAAETAWAGTFDHSHALFDRVLKAHVRDGLVDYSALKTEPGELDAYLEETARVSKEAFDSWDAGRQLAFLFNLYNAATLRLIIDHYPVKSINDLAIESKSPWDLPVVKLFGKSTTLNAVENGLLRKRYDEPRLHMALVCAAKGCPPLRNEAYVADRLNEQLEDQTRKFISDPAKFRIDGEKETVFISPIFKWYGDDFIKNYTPASGFGELAKSDRAVVNFCARHLSKTDRIYLESGSYKVEFLDYDWSLNDSKKGP